MTKLATLVTIGLLFTAPAFAQTMGGDAQGTQGGQTGKANANEKGTTGMNSSGSNSVGAPANGRMQNDSMKKMNGPMEGSTSKPGASFDKDDSMKK